MVWPTGQGGGTPAADTVAVPELREKVGVVPLFTDYSTDGFFDEMFEAPDLPRPAYERLFSGLRALRPATFTARSALVAFARGFC